MEKFWPGPLTIVFPKKDIIPKETSGGLDTVALRCPQNAATRALIKAAGVPLAGPSANISGRPSPTTTDDVLHDMNGRISAVVDDGPCNIGLESTIIGVENGEIVVYRPGGITLEMLQEIGPARMDSNLIVDTGHPKAPGMKYRHYAPKADLAIVEGPTEEVIKAINQFVKEDAANGLQSGIIATEETISQYPDGIVKCIGSRAAEETIAHNLYEVLREFDQCQVSKIYSEAFYTPKMGQAIMNRLLKAAGHKIINVGGSNQ